MIWRTESRVSRQSVTAFLRLAKNSAGGGAGISKTSKIDGVDLNRTNLQCSTANGIKIPKIFDIGDKAAAVGEAGYIFADEEVTICPGNVMSAAPAGKSSLTTCHSYAAGSR